ncbi:MAG: hypothetical protein ABJB86_14670 [Bacteroidota bacterium]
MNKKIIPDFPVWESLLVQQGLYVTRIAGSNIAVGSAIEAFPY